MEFLSSNHELEEFAYIASHDLQAPLRHISLIVQLLTQKIQPDPDPETQQWLHSINRSVNNMEKMIGDLLAYCKVRTCDLESETIDLRELIKSVSYGAEASILLDDLPIVRGYATALKQIFQNLISNSVKFRKPNDPLRISVSTEESETEWIIAVKDNGIGIAEEHHDRIFQIFQRLHPKGAYEGTGIGLSICKKAVELHGGRIWLESKVNEGSVFYISLPKAMASK